MSTEEKPSMLKKLVGRLSSGELSSRDLCEGLLRRVQKWNPTLRAILSIEEDRVMQRAEELDRRRGQGADLGVLGGIPVGVKDNLCSRVGRTTCGSRMLENFKSPYDSHVVSRLDDSGAVLFGKTNLDEFAMGGST
ncbi:MAG: Glutamyl-tRNA(Gln) amidotransferase subunit, partial [Planctomycetota bacterium]